MSTTAIHEAARRMVAQSPRPMDLGDAYRHLNRRAQVARSRREHCRTSVRSLDLRALSHVESPPIPVNYRLPYKDND